MIGRIFREFVAGDSPEPIARRLNREGIAGPGGRPWSNTTIRGQAARGTDVMIELVDLHPREGGKGLDAALYGDLAAISA